MVCSRCKMVVSDAVAQEGLHIISVELGEIEIEEMATKEQLKLLNARLQRYGFEIINDRKKRTIERIKNLVVALVHQSSGQIQTNLSDYLSTQLHYDYNYLSNLFSEVTGTTIEKYFIAQRIEKAKELLLYDELSLSEIADRLHYSSVAHLSNQFKKQTGLSPSFYKNKHHGGRRNLEDL